MPEYPTTIGSRFSETLAEAVRPKRTGPESYVTQGVEPLENSELLKVANDVLQGLEYSYVAVAADPASDVADGSVEADFKASLQAMSDERRARAQQAAAPLASADQQVRQRLFGRWGQFSPSDVRASGLAGLGEELAPVRIDHKLVGLGARALRVPMDHLRVDGGRLIVDLPGLDEFEDAEDVRSASLSQLQRAAESRVHPEKLEEIWDRSFFPDDAFAPPASDFEEFEAAIPDKFSVDVRKVKCVDETNPEFWGSDEIALGGTGIDESGDVTKIGERFCGGGFDDGDQKWLGWSSWETFNLREPISLKKGWPKKYRVIFILAEKDHGGLEKFLSDLYAKVREQVKRAIEKAIAEGLKVYLGEVLSTVLGKVVAWIVDKFISWLIGLFGDDIFPAATSTMTHVHYNARFTINGTWGYLYSPTYRAHFYGHGGHYWLEYRWRLHN